MKTSKPSGDNRPSAYIAVNKQRVKQYNKNVYLKNGTEFQLELFNPMQTKILAKIYLNGNSIGDGIVLRPGERVFLDRHISEAKKLLFETYTVDGNNNESKKAIERNGEVKVYFYQENLILDNIFHWDKEITYLNTWKTYKPYGYHYDYSDFNSIGLNGTMTTTSYDSFGTNSEIKSNDHISITNNNNWYNPNTSTTNQTYTCYNKPKDLETGRVEKGGYSNQKFKQDNSDFNLYYNCCSEWKILPESRKQITSDDLVLYCASCGRKKKQNERYCPSCGNKL